MIKLHAGRSDDGSSHDGSSLFELLGKIMSINRITWYLLTGLHTVNLEGYELMVSNYQRLVSTIKQSGTNF